MFTPVTRYHADADTLRRLADWVDHRADDVDGHHDHLSADAVALDYFRLAHELRDMADRCTTFASIYAGQMP